MNSSTRKTELTHETNNWEIAHKSWMERCSRQTLGFSRRNLPKHYLQKKKTIIFNGLSSKFNPYLRRAGSA